jgi:hypothetical protein
VESAAIVPAGSLFDDSLFSPSEADCDVILRAFDGRPFVSQPCQIASADGQTVPAVLVFGTSRQFARELAELVGQNVIIWIGYDTRPDILVVR